MLKKIVSKFGYLKLCGVWGPWNRKSKTGPNVIWLSPNLAEAKHKKTFPMFLQSLQIRRENCAHLPRPCWSYSDIKLSGLIDCFQRSPSIRSPLTPVINVMEYAWLRLFYGIWGSYVFPVAALFGSSHIRMTTLHFCAVVCHVVYCCVGATSALSCAQHNARARLLFCVFCILSTQGSLSTAASKSSGRHVWSRNSNVLYTFVSHYYSADAFQCLSLSARIARPSERRFTGALYVRQPQTTDAQLELLILIIGVPSTWW